MKDNVISISETLGVKGMNAFSQYLIETAIECDNDGYDPDAFCLVTAKYCWTEDDQGSAIRENIDKDVLARYIGRLSVEIARATNKMLSMELE